MALNLGQLITGGAAFARGQRETEQAERIARQQQLQIEALNRQEQLRREMLQAPMAAPQAGGLQIPEPLGVRPIVQAPKITAAPAAAPTTVPAPTPAAAPAAVTPTVPALGEYEALYERVKSLKRSGVVGRFDPTNLSMLSDKQAFSDEDLARVYAIALSKQDSSTANALKNVLTQRGVDPKYLRDVAYKTARGQREIVKAESEADRAAEERRRLFELKTGRRVSAAVGGVAVPESKAPTAQSIDSSSAITRVIQREGGYVNDPADMGGETKFGISKKAYPNLDVANLTETQAAAIYKRDYWDAIGADQLPANIREIAFDAAVNHGVETAKQLLAQAGNDPQKFLQLRANLYQQIVDANPSQAKFLDGWMNRLRDLAAGVVSAAVPAAVAAPAAPAAAPAPAAVPTAGVAPVTASLPAQAERYLADPTAVPRDMQIAMQQREELARLAGMYQRSGMGSEFMQTRAKVMELDNNMMYLQGMQGIQELFLANDPRRLTAVWSEYTGMKVNVQPRSDGMFDILVGNKRVREGLSGNEITTMARLSFDTGYRQAQAQAGAEANMEAFKAQLEVQKDQAKQLAQMIREINVARVQGNINQALEWAKANYKWDINPTGAGDGTIIIRPPGGVPYLFNSSGRTVEVDGVKITTNSAYPIAGLPSYGGALPR
jgi:hypothetical protein